MGEHGNAVINPVGSGRSALPSAAQEAPDLWGPCPLEWGASRRGLFLWYRPQGDWTREVTLVFWVDEGWRPGQPQWDPEPEPWPRRQTPGRQRPENTVFSHWVISAA